MEATVVLSGSVQDSTIFKSGAEAGTLKLHPLFPEVETLSFSMNVAFKAFRKSTRPHPSWLFGAVSPAPFVTSLY